MPISKNYDNTLQKMQQQPLTARQFCFWDAKSEGDTIILIVNSSMAFIILLISAYRLLNLRRFDELDRQKRKTLLQIHGFIFAWAIMFLIENAYAIVYFYTQLYTISPPDDISDPSKTYAVLDKVPSFLVRTIFLKICFFHYNGLMCRIQAKNFTTKQIKFFKWLTIYYWGRILIQVMGILGFLIFEEQVWTISTINVVIVLLDGLLTCLAQVASLIVFIKKCDLLDRMEEDDKAKLKRQFYIMIGTGVIGFFLNLIFLIIRPLFGDIGKCMDPFEKHLPFSITHNILGLFFLNFIPLFWILKMYSYIRHKSIIIDSSQMSSEGRLLD